MVFLSGLKRACFATGQHLFLLLWCVVGFIGFFSFSQGAVIWVYVSEFSPTAVRAKGQSLGSFTHWFMNAAVSGVFPVLGCQLRCGPVLFLCRRDGLAIRSRMVHISGDPWCPTRRNGAPAEDQTS